MTAPLDPLAIRHVDALRAALAHLDLARVARWGVALGDVLARGGALLVAGNGGSAAHAQHLAAELVGRYRVERPPLRALALHAETSSVTAIANDYGYDEVFARQVRAHGQPGDVLLGISTSGASRNVVAAAETARMVGCAVWALTGARACPLASVAHDTLAVAAESTATVQEVHQVVVHLLCESVDRVVTERLGVRTAP